MHNVSYIKKGEIYTNIILNKLKYYQGSPTQPIRRPRSQPTSLTLPLLSEWEPTWPTGRPTSYISTGSSTAQERSIDDRRSTHLMGPASIEIGSRNWSRAPRESPICRHVSSIPTSHHLSTRRFLESGTLASRLQFVAILFIYLLKLSRHLRGHCLIEREVSHKSYEREKKPPKKGRKDLRAEMFGEFGGPWSIDFSN